MTVVVQTTIPNSVTEPRSTPSSSLPCTTHKVFRSPPTYIVYRLPTSADAPSSNPSWYVSPKSPTSPTTRMSTTSCSTTTTPTSRHSTTVLATASTPRVSTAAVSTTMSTTTPLPTNSSTLKVTWSPTTPPTMYSAGSTAPISTAAPVWVSAALASPTIPATTMPPTTSTLRRTAATHGNTKASPTTTHAWHPAPVSRQQYTTTPWCLATSASTSHTRSQPPCCPPTHVLFRPPTASTATLPTMSLSAMSSTSPKQTSAPAPYSTSCLLLNLATSTWLGTSTRRPTQSPISWFATTTPKTISRSTTLLQNTGIGMSPPNPQAMFANTTATSPLPAAKVWHGS